MAQKQWVVIPIGATTKVCRFCETLTYWVRTETGQYSMIDSDVGGGSSPDAFSEGRGVRHFTVCRGDAE